MSEFTEHLRGNIYLSGGMQHAEGLGAEWREEVSAELLNMGYYPLDITALDLAYQEQHGDLFNCGDGDSQSGLLQKKANIRKHFINADLRLINNESDALIVYYDESARLGAGTISECQVAYNLGLPIFIVNAYDDIDEIPGWLLALSTKVFDYFFDLYIYLAELPLGILKKDIYGNHNSGNKYLCSLSGEVFDKEGLHFVSTVSPLYNKESVEVVRAVNEHKDRYEFFVEHIKGKLKNDG